MKQINLLFLISLCSLILGCKDKKPNIDPNLTFVSKQIPGILPYFKGALLDPYWSEDRDLPSDLKRILNLSLVSEQNKTFDLDEYPNHYKIIVFFYAKCTGVCPMITSNLIRFLPKLKNQKKLIVLSVSINPEEDTVEELKKYRSRYKIEQSNWIFLTGDREQIHSLARDQFSADVKFIKGKYDWKDFVHTENVFLLDTQNYLRGVYRAKGTGDLERLVAEYELLAGK
ncbi:SCO1/SenC [Leptospira ryugenii]|uniref:SCO1/SenC n=1 Tax=Leptospira ryugenii TaxID=1917863 RepID=A0A2P2E0Q2_9LEPT|nr:SCO family protein [Leptospira ryugenii]GBF50467.1 SCO1/SenC [Leptospira ryugenii]